MVEAAAAHTTFWEGRALRLLLLLPLSGFAVLSVAALHASQTIWWWIELPSPEPYHWLRIPNLDWTSLTLLWTGATVFVGVLAALGLGPWPRRDRRVLPPWTFLAIALIILGFLVAAMAGFNPLPSWNVAASLAGRDLMGINTPALLAFVTASLLAAAMTLFAWRPDAQILERIGLILTAGNGLLAFGFMTAFLELLASEPGQMLPKG